MPVTEKTNWVLVADEAIARILRKPELMGDLEPVEEMTDPDAHARGADLRNDAVGRRAGSAPQGSQQNSPHRLRGTASATASAGESELHLEADGFARRVAAHLDQALQQKRFDTLKIVAAPRFLGLLRKHVSKQVAATITDTLNKDYIHMKNDEITRRLDEASTPDPA